IQNDGFNYMYMDCPDNGTCHPVLPFRYLTHRLRLRVPSKHKIMIFAGFLIFVRLRHVDTLITPSPSDMHLALAIQMVQVLSCV
ncbi:hypothetical protein A2U01_0051907, partial [Trifolium medium]|nr:hypothetical protein [Trifolium medium]